MLPAARQLRTCYSHLGRHISGARGYASTHSPRGLEYRANSLSLQVLRLAVTRIMQQNMPFLDEIKLENVYGKLRSFPEKFYEKLVRSYVVRDNNSSTD